MITCEHPTHKTYERARLELVRDVNEVSTLHDGWAIEARAESIVESLTEGLAVLRARTRDVEDHLESGECLALQAVLRDVADDIATDEVSQRRATVPIPDRRWRVADRRTKAVGTRVNRGRRKGD